MYFINSLWESILLKQLTAVFSVQQCVLLLHVSLTHKWAFWISGYFGVVSQSTFFAFLNCSISTSCTCIILTASVYLWTCSRKSLAFLIDFSWDSRRLCEVAYYFVSPPTPSTAPLSCPVAENNHFISYGARFN